MIAPVHPYNHCGGVCVSGGEPKILGPAAVSKFQS